MPQWQVTHAAQEVGNGRFAADAAQFGAAMNSIAHSQAMLAAIKDYTKVRWVHWSGWL
jgi:hypothetical protein